MGDLKTSYFAEPKLATIRKLLAIILILSAVIRFAWVCYSGLGAAPVDDAFQYHHLALSLAQGSGYNIDGITLYHRAPGYVFLLTVFYFFAPYVVTGVFVNIILGVLTVFFVFLLAKEFFGPTVGLVSAAIMAVYPPAIGISHMLITENLSIFLSIVFILLLLRALHKPKTIGIMYSIFAGISLGFLILTRPVFQTAILFLPFVIYLMVKSFKRTVLVSLFVAIACILIISPWTIHNYKNYGKFIPVSTWGAIFAFSNTPYILENEEYRGWWVQIFPDDYFTEEEKKDLTDAGFLDLKNDETLKRAAFRFILNHPSEELSIVGYKLLFLVIPRAQANSLANIVYLVSYYLFLVLTLCGAVLWIRIGGKAFIASLSLIIPHIISEIFFYPCIRFSLPIQPFLLILSALTLVVVFNIKKGRIVHPIMRRKY